MLLSDDLKNIEHTYIFSEGKHGNFSNIENLTIARPTLKKTGYQIGNEPATYWRTHLKTLIRTQILITKQQKN